jgi:hypothetical protein
VATIPDGGEGRAGFGVYPTKNLGLSVFGQVDHGQYYWNSSVDYDAVAGGGAVSYWLSPQAQVSLSYSPTWLHSAGENSWHHPVAMELTLRLP